MEVNAGFLKELRQEKGWTQQHLAEACGLNLRTIQRVEKEGVASNDTVQALCAVFEVERAALSVIPQVEASQLEVAKSDLPYLLVVLTLAIGILLGSGATYYLLK